jgi:molybdenum cofactor cytidylyltransferase
MATGGATDTTLETIVLAAGFGARFGGGKLTAPWRDGILLDAALTAAFAAPARTVTVVWGADPAVPHAAKVFAERMGQAARLTLVHATDHAEGMAATLRAGIASLAPETSGAFVFLGDMPRVPAAVLPALADAVASGAVAAAPRFEGRRGHPVLFSAALFPQLLALTGDKGARAVLQKLGATLATVEAPDEGVLFDIDLPTDMDGAEAR